MVEFNGKQIKLAKGKEARAEAIRLFHEKIAAMDAVPSAGRGPTTVREVCEGHQAWSLKHNSKAAAAEKSLRLQDFAAEFGDREAASIRPSHVTAWVDAHPSWVSAWTRGNAVKYLRAAFNWAVREGLLERNPLVGVTAERGGSFRPLTPVEYRQIAMASRGGINQGPRSSSGRRFREVMAFLRLTGCRPAEMRLLQWDQIRWDHGVAVLSNHKTVKKTSKPRVVALPPLALRLLRSIQRRDGNCGYCFVTWAGEPWGRNGVTQHFRDLRDRIGLPKDCVPYGLRHAYATNAILGGVDPLTLAALLGHTTSRMSERYTHLANEYTHLTEAATRAGRRTRKG